MNLFRLMKTVALLVAAVASLGACGQKGPLLPPPKNTPPQVVTPIILPGEADTEDKVDEADADAVGEPVTQPEARDTDTSKTADPSTRPQDGQDQPQDNDDKPADDKSAGIGNVIVEEKQPAKEAGLSDTPYRAVERESDETPLGILPHTSRHTPLNATTRKK